MKDRNLDPRRRPGETDREWLDRLMDMDKRTVPTRLRRDLYDQLAAERMLYLGRRRAAKWAVMGALMLFGLVQLLLWVLP